MMNFLEVLRRVEAGPCHSLPSRGFRGPTKAAASALVAQGWLALLPARGRFERRYVVTINGSYALGSFRMMGDIRAEVWALRRARAA